MVGLSLVLAYILWDSQISHFLWMCLSVARASKCRWPPGRAVQSRGKELFNPTLSPNERTVDHRWLVVSLVMAMYRSLHRNPEDGCRRASGSCLMKFCHRVIPWRGRKGTVLLPPGLILLISPTSLPICTLCSFLCNIKISGSKMVPWVL